MDDGQTQRLTGRFVSPSFFNVMGVEPQLGRLLVEAEHIAKPPHVAVVSHRLWQQRFNGKRDDLASLDREAGRLRSFLLTALRNYSSNVRDRKSTLKRGDQHAHVSIDHLEAEEMFQRLPVDLWFHKV